MAPKRNTIPLHRLEEQTDQGFQLKRVDVADAWDQAAMVMHRDDHFVFMLHQRGSSKVAIDFEQFTINANTVICILPGQVHCYNDIAEGAGGWYLALDPGLIPDTYRAVLEDPFLSKPLPVSAEGMGALVQCLELAFAVEGWGATPFTRQAVHSLLSSFTAMLIDLYAGRQEMPTEQVSRIQSITREFRKMLAARYKSLKSPGEYASGLHLSPSYLNEAVKEATGFTVSHWIQQEIVLEAKRLLYYSRCSVKEIAHELGYADHAYFSRLFKKMVGRTPGAFRTAFGPAKPRH